MKHVTTTRLSGVLSALLLAGTAAFAQLNMPLDQSAGRKVATALDPAATVRGIQSSAFENREDLISGIEARVREIDAIFAAVSLSDAAKEEIRKAADALAGSIKRSRDTTAAYWDKARTDLGDRYSAYAETVVRVAQAAADPAR